MGCVSGLETIGCQSQVIYTDSVISNVELGCYLCGQVDRTLELTSKGLGVRFPVLAVRKSVWQTSYSTLPQSTTCNIKVSGKLRIPHCLGSLAAMGTWYTDPRLDQ